VPVAPADWISQTIVPMLRRHASLLLAGALVVFLAGGASVARLVRNAPRPKPPTTRPSAPVPVEAAIPVSELPLRLLATSVAAEPIRSIAFVADTGRGAPQLLREGDAFAFHPRVRLTRVEPTRALIDNQGRTEMLELDPDASLWRADGDPVPVYSDGAPTGVELHHVRPGGLYARIGLREGDRVGAINGVALSSSEAGSALLRALTESPEIELTVERSDGTPTRITVPREKLPDELRAPK
jgi:type II secretory pathway component PulC